jgi:hypothetical protein
MSSSQVSPQTAANALIKQGTTQPTSTDAQRNLLFRQLAAQDVRDLALAGFGLGAAGRGLYGLYNMVQRSRRSTPPSTITPHALTVEIPTEEEDDEEVPQPPSRVADAMQRIKKWTGDRSSDAMRHIKGWAGKLKTGQEKTAVVENPFGQEKAQSKEEIWWYPAGTILGMGGGLYGGWKLLDSIMDTRRQQVQEDELEQARTQFRSALRPEKHASALGSDLDALYDTLQEKRASVGGTLRKLQAGYGVYAGLSGLLSGMWMYERAKKRQRRALLEKAKKQRLRERYQSRPPQIFAVPAAEEEEDLPKAPTPAAIPA